MQERRAIVFDNKIPLTWLLSSAGTVLALLVTVLWNVANQNNKLDQLVLQAQKAETYNVERDKKLETLMKDGYETRRVSDLINLRLEAVEKVKK